MRNKWFQKRYLLTTLILGLFVTCGDGSSLMGDDQLEYSVPDSQLKVIRIDSSETESFLSIRADTQGRIFVGGREALFVYEPDENGRYKPRKELYRFPPHSWIYDIEIRGRDLYLLTLNALYLIPDGAIKDGGLKPKRILWGVPLGHVHQCFHGLAWGPEGDLYISMGDPMWYYGDFNRPDHWGHWTFFSQPEGTKIPYTGVGGVFRCRPDGTNFQIVSRGLRNSCGLAFDSNWNLFTNDNDHEGMPHAYVPGRLIHVTHHSYFSWPRGWMLHITPDRADLLETMTTGMGRAVPVGQAYYNETFLPETYRNNLLIARWGLRTVARYPLQQRGASFKTKELTLLDGRNQARPVGVGVGRGGRIFATISYMAHNDSSPVYKSDLVMITRKDDLQTSPFEAYNILTADTNRLWKELSNRSWWRRYRAHTEILRRGDDAISDILTNILTKSYGTDSNHPAIAHVPWLISAVSDKQKRRKVLGILQILTSSQFTKTIRLQSIRALSEFFAKETPRKVFETALRDPDPQVRHAAVLAFFKTKGPLPDEIASGPARSDDTYLRQAATLLLAENATLSDLKTLCNSSDPKTRLAGVLAAGFRLTIPPATEPIPSNLPLEPWRSEEVYKMEYVGEKVDLRDFGRIGLFTVAEHWKAAKHTKQQEQLFAILKSKLADPDEKTQLQAAHFLYLLDDSRTEPAIAKVRKVSEQRRLVTARTVTVKTAWIAGPFPDGEDGLQKTHPPEKGAIDLSAKYNVDGTELAWKQMKKGVRMFDFLKQFGPCDRSSYYTYCRLESPRKQQVMLLVGSDDGVKIWNNGKIVWTNPISRAALPYQDVVFVELQPGSNDLLVRVQNNSGECALYLHFRTLGEVAVTLPEKLGIASLAERLKAASGGSGTAKLSKEFLDVDWSAASQTGDQERGRKLFSADGIGCAKCHADRPEVAVQGGPSLTGAGKRFTVSHLVESILLPSKHVSPVFQSTLIVTTNGKSYSGLVLNETAEKIELMLPDAKRQTILKDEIDVRKIQKISPMPQGIVKKPDELRDLLAYLLRN